MPHPTTLMKLTTRCGSAAVEGLNEALLAKAGGRETVALCSGPGRHHGGAVERGLSHRRGSAGEGGWSDRSDRSADSCGGRRHQDAAAGPVPAAGKRAHAIASKLRSRAAAGREEAMAAVTKANAELADLADTAARRPVGCWPTRNGRCGKPEPLRRNGRSTACRTRSRVGVGVAWPVPSTILKSFWRRPDGSRPRLGSGWPGSPRTGRPGGSACTTPTPGRSRRPARQAGRVRPQSPSC